MEEQAVQLFGQLLHELNIPGFWEGLFFFKARELLLWLLP